MHPFQPNRDGQEQVHASAPESSAFQFTSAGVDKRKWIGLIQKGFTAKRLWVEKGKKSRIDAGSWIILRNFLLSSLKSPTLPLPPTSREEYNERRRTLLQFHLFHLLLPGEEIKPGLFHEDLRKSVKELAEGLAALSQKELSEICGNLFKYRWYQFSAKNSSDKLASEIGNLKSLSMAPTLCSTLYASSLHYELSDLEKFFEAFLESCRHFCRVSRGIILREKSLMLQEYTKRWCGFSASMIEVEQKWNSISRVVGSLYSKAFPEYQNTPKFSFERAMTRLWIEKVYNKIRGNLFELFRTKLEGLREEKLLSIKPAKNTKLASAVKFDLDYFLSSEKEKPDMEGFVVIGDCSTKHLLYRFVNAIADLSLNEISVHYLGHSRLEPDKPYMDLHRLILSATKKFYKKSANEIPLMNFHKLLQEDGKIMEKIVLPKTVCEIARLKQNYLEKYLRHYISKRFKQFKGLESFRVEKEHSNLLTKFVVELASGSDPRLALSFTSHFCSLEPDVAAMYESIFSQREVPEPESDRIIDYINAKRGISQELAPDEASLYSCFSVITPKLLESLSSAIMDSFEVISDSEAQCDPPPPSASSLFFFSKN